MAERREPRSGFPEPTNATAGRRVAPALDKGQPAGRREGGSTLRPLGSLLTTLILLVAPPWAGAGEPAPADGAQVLARVGDTVITVPEYRAALHQRQRWTFYHGQPPEGERATFRRKVADELIDRVLLLQEVERREIQVQPHAVEQALKGKRASAAQRKQVEQQLRIQRLREQVEDVAPPKEADLRGYFKDHPEKFTEPERLRLSLILLGVNASAPPQAWDAARREAEQMVAELRDGASFEETARLRSADQSAAKGGDMGYVHRGMLGDPVQKIIAELEPGEVSDPAMVLEGIAVFRLDDRQSAHRMEYARVRERVKDLWRRERREKAWQGLLQDLRAKTPITINEQYLEPQHESKENAQRGRDVKVLARRFEGSVPKEAGVP